VRWFFRSLHPIYDRKKYLKFLSCCAKSTGLGQDLTHLAHKENMHSEVFLLGRLKILIAFCSLTALT
jgi:hypothetical protein